MYLHGGLTPKGDRNFLKYMMDNFFTRPIKQVQKLITKVKKYQDYFTINVQKYYRHKKPDLKPLLEPNPNTIDDESTLG